MAFAAFGRRHYEELCLLLDDLTIATGRPACLASLAGDTTEVVSQHGGPPMGRHACGTMGCSMKAPSGSRTGTSWRTAALARDSRQREVMSQNRIQASALDERLRFAVGSAAAPAAPEPVVFGLAARKVVACGDATWRNLHKALLGDPGGQSVVTTMANGINFLPQVFCAPGVSLIVVGPAASRRRSRSSFRGVASCQGARGCGTRAPCMIACGRRRQRNGSARMQMRMPPRSGPQPAPDDAGSAGRDLGVRPLAGRPPSRPAFL